MSETGLTDADLTAQIVRCRERFRAMMRGVVMRWDGVAGTRPTDALEVALERSVKGIEFPRGEGDTDEAEALTLARAIVYLSHRNEGRIEQDAMVSFVLGVLRELVMVTP